MTTPLPPQRYVHQNERVLLDRYGLSPRLVRRYQQDGRLSKIKPGGRTGPVLVDLEEVERFMDASREHATDGPLAGQGGDLDAFARRWAEDRDPEAQAALIAIGQIVDSALWDDDPDDV